MKIPNIILPTNLKTKINNSKKVKPQSDFIDIFIKHLIVPFYYFHTKPIIGSLIRDLQRLKFKLYAHGMYSYDLNGGNVSGKPSKKMGVRYI